MAGNVYTNNAGDLVVKVTSYDESLGLVTYEFYPELQFNIQWCLPVEWFQSTYNKLRGTA